MSNILTNQEIEERIRKNECLLLGQVPISNEEILDLLDYAQKTISNSQYFINENEPNLKLSLALVQIAISDYQDGNYWSKLIEKLQLDELNGQKQGIIGRCFLTTIRKYGLFELKENERASQFVENIKAHAFVTNNYMNDYFEFLNDYYENILFRDLTNTEDVESSLESLAEYLETTLDSSIDTLSQESKSGSIPKSYKLLKATREVIANNSSSILYNLFIHSLQLLDNFFYDDIVPEDDGSRFTQGFIKWVTQENNRNKIKDKREIAERKKYSKKPCIRNINKNGEIRFELFIPKRVYRKNECNGEISANIEINGITRKVNLEVSKDFGSYISEDYSLQILNPFDEIKLTIKTNSKENFVFKRTDYAFFNNNHILTNRLEKPLTTLYTRKNINVRVVEENNLDSIENYENIIRYLIQVDENTICYIDEKPFSIIGQYSEEPIFDDIIENFNVYNERNEIINAVRRHPTIFYIVPSNKIKGTALTINNRNFSVDRDEKIKVMDYPGDIEKKIVSADINELIENNTGLYKIEINRPGENNKVITQYLLLRRFNYRFDKYRYITEKNANLKLYTEFLNYKINNENCKITFINKEISTANYSVELSEKIREMNITLFINEQKFFITFPINMVLYGPSLERLQYGIKDYTWYKDINQYMIIIFPNTKKLGLFIDKNTKNITWGTYNQDGYYNFNLKNIINEIYEINKKYVYINIRFEDYSEKDTKLYKAIKTIIINPYFDIEFYEGKMCFNITEMSEVENISVYYSITEEGKSEPIISHRKLLKGVNYLPELERNKNYFITPVMEEKDKFGFGIKEQTMPSRRRGIMNATIPLTLQKTYTKKLIIDSFVIGGFNYALKGNYDYFVDITKIKNRKEMLGYLYEIKEFSDGHSEKRNMGKVRITNYHFIANNYYFEIKQYSETLDDWVGLTYIKDQIRLIENDNEILDSLTTSNVIILEYDDYKYVSKEGIK